MVVFPIPTWQLEVGAEYKLLSGFVLQHVSAGHQPIFGLAVACADWVQPLLREALRRAGLLEHAGPRGPGASYEIRPRQSYHEMAPE